MIYLLPWEEYKPSNGEKHKIYIRHLLIPIDKKYIYIPFTFAIEEILDGDGETGNGCFHHPYISPINKQYNSVEEAMSFLDRKLLQLGYYLIKPEEVEKFQNKLKILL